MGSSPNEDDLLRIACAAKAIDQQKVAANMAFAMICPIPGQRMIEPLSAKRCIAGYQQQHCFL